MNAIYYPKKELSLDESMVLWRGRLVFRQYIQNKCLKYGIKLYMLTEPDGLVIKFAVYTGVFDDMEGQGNASIVVLYLMSEKLENGHSLYMDNFYNSFDLATLLIQKNTYCTGTLRLNRKNTLVEVKKDETIARYSNGVVIGKRRDKREVAYISTEFKNNLVVSTNTRGHNQTKPEPIVNYSKFMSGIDRQDQMQSYYPCIRKTIRWYKKIGIHIEQMLLMNSFYLYNKYKI
ncbi:PREDICTED: piggyBac transposable element-derived protein 4-like [Diuraphis noxia]|uniref:piggyBac transposable element-derived protein 4-like n=1 Tax=Diuraphis noxia TaxID=143948 RepID=UPI000763A240|nr:PREDICTED: piggyBac transposable element-derived protein 4-like [Diuraphis noxia]